MKHVFAASLGALLACAAVAHAARPSVRVDREWLLPVEEGAAPERVRDPRPAGATDALYTLRFRYEGEEPVNRLEIVQPMPVGLRYSPGSATGPRAVITFSVDGGKTFDVPEALTIPVEGGEPRPATADDYTHIRWELIGDFPPGLAGILSFRASAGPAVLESVEDAQAK
ncbi:MAG: hypothetical protein P8080_11515 [Gammaproteobacteria bacterium]